MSIISNVLGLFLGNKYERDIKEIMPFVEATKKESEKLGSLSNDELRNVTLRLKSEIKDYIQSDQEEILKLKEQAAQEPDFAKKEEIYNQTDKVTKSVDSKIEEILEKVLPTAFAIVKETSKRFKENEVLEVTAQQYDRDLASSRESITIKGDKAYWKNTWLAGGNEILWDMVHYDVQLIGGVALHKGKISEMGTGEGKTLVATLPVFQIGRASCMETV